MFDDYPFIHVHVDSPITEHSHNIAHQVRIQGLPSPEDASDYRNDQISGGDQSYTRYKITGSFDYLAPYIPKKILPHNYPLELSLQSFCLMNNTYGYYTRRKDYESLLLSYTFSGIGKLNYMGQETVIQPGSGFIINCVNPHEYASGKDGWEHLDIHIWGNKQNPLLSMLSDRGILAFSVPPFSMTQMADQLLDAYITYSDMRDLYIGNALSNILCTVLKQAETVDTSEVPNAYKNIVRHMENHYTKKISLDSLSKDFNISKYHLSREFKKYVGYTPNEYLIALRIQHACVLLSGSELSIENVAAESGFTNISNFINQFKKHVGMTPRAFRNSNLEY